MQLVFLLAALCCVDASAVVIVKNTYASKTCSKSDLFKIEENEYQVGCKNGAKYFVDGNTFKGSAYNAADCTGTATSTTDVAALKSCVATGDLSQEYLSMSDADFKKYSKGSANLLIEKHLTTSNCSDTSSILEIRLDSRNDKCVKVSSTSSGKMTWNDKKSVTKNYANAKCSGTGTVTAEKKFKTCVNTTNSASEFITRNPISLTSSAMRSISLQSAMVFGIIFTASCLY